jgi:hypothetical protein
MKYHRWWILLALLAPLNPGCLCSGNGHVQPMSFQATQGDNVVNCACNLSFKHEVCGGDCAAHFAIELCVPPELRTITGADIPDAGLAPDGGDGGVTLDEIYAQRMDRYCRDTVTNVAYHLIQVFNGGWCDYKSGFAPDGGIGDSVSCFAQPLDGQGMRATTNAPTCEEQCPAVPCSHETNCGEGVQDSQGNIHLDKCQCSQVRESMCPGDPPEWLPTPVFCRP